MPSGVEVSELEIVDEPVLSDSRSIESRAIVEGSPEEARSCPPSLKLRKMKEMGL